MLLLIDVHKFGGKGMLCCDFCGKSGIKLWRPQGGHPNVCVCASCAEKMRVPISYIKHKWIWNSSSMCWNWEGKRNKKGEIVPIGRRVTINNWAVDYKGTAPVFEDSPADPRFQTKPKRTVVIRVDFAAMDSERYPSKVTVLEPAILTKTGWIYWRNLPDSMRKMWTKLPTR